MNINITKFYKKFIRSDMVKGIKGIKGITEMNWYYFRFRVNDRNEEARWWIDLFILNEIVNKIVKVFNPDLWRIHRRAIGDNSGHQVSFLYYTDKKRYKEVDKYIKNNKSFKLLYNPDNPILSDYIVFKDNEDIGGTSDRHWCKGIRDSWPFFIQGASKAFLELLDSVVTDYTHIYDYNYDNILEIEGLYMKVDKKIGDIWYYEGGHAFLHHLSAIFGYKNIKTRQTVITSF